MHQAIFIRQITDFLLVKGELEQMIQLELVDTYSNIRHYLQPGQQTRLVRLGIRSLLSLI
jgi:hypothetical protein